MFKKQIVFPKNLGSGSLFSSVTHLQELVCGAVYDVVTKPSFWMRRPSALGVRLFSCDDAALQV